MDYSNYSIKEKALIAAIIMAIVEFARDFQGIGLGNSSLEQLLKAKSQQDFEKNCLSVAITEISKRN